MSESAGELSDHRKRHCDPNQVEKFVVGIAIGEVEDRWPTPEEHQS
jgi:hypothetical protein